MNGFEGCRYLYRTLQKKYTMSVERENVVLNRKVSDLLHRNRQLVRDLNEANSNIDALEFEIQCLTAECDPENDPCELVDETDIKVSPIVLTNTSHGSKIVIHRGEGECSEEEEDLDPKEDEVNEEPALDMSASDYEKEAEEEAETPETPEESSSEEETPQVKSAGDLELEGWTTWELARY